MYIKIHIYIKIKYNLYSTYFYTLYNFKLYILNIITNLYYNKLKYKLIHINIIELWNVPIRKVLRLLYPITRWRGEGSLRLSDLLRIPDSKL